MKTITSYLNFTVALQQISMWKPFYEVRCGDELLGTINFPRRLNDRGEAVSADGTWSFERDGLLKFKRIAKENNTVIASYKPDTFRQSGSMTIGEEQYRVKFGFFSRSFDILSHYDEQIIHIKNRGVFRLRSEITFSPLMKRNKQFSLMFFFGCYIMITAVRDAERRAAVG